MSYGQRTLPQTLTVPSTASTTTVGTAFTIPQGYSSLSLIADLASHTGGTLDVYLQDSFDEGTTWYDAAHFGQLSAATTATVAASVSSTGTPAATAPIAIGKGTLGSPSVALAASTLRPGPWGTTLRIVAVTSGGTSGASKVQTITFALTTHPS